MRRFGLSSAFPPLPPFQPFDDLKRQEAPLLAYLKPYFSQPFGKIRADCGRAGLEVAAELLKIHRTVGVNGPMLSAFVVRQWVIHGYLSRYTATGCEATSHNTLGQNT